VQAEQGLGDAIQFARFVPRIDTNGGGAGGGHLLLRCAASLVELLRSMEGGAQIVADAGDASVPRHDVHAHLMSLPHLLGHEASSEAASEAAIARDVPYLRADARRVAEWSARLPAREASRRPLRVGLAWASNPLNRHTPMKTPDPKQFAPLAQVSGVEWFSLQKDRHGSSPPPLPLIDLTPQIRDFADTAALMQHLDLIVSIDTAVAHLAGALGRVVWTMLPYAAEWRWRIDRVDTPWYPTMRLFRQPAPGDWGRVTEEVRRELLGLVPRG